MHYKIISILLFFLFHVSNYAQNLIPPMDIPLYLSGNFGELRSNHFHSGIDFKTESRTGIPVKSVKDGYLERLVISPWGYGRVLYITHPDGTQTVYGHLDRFSKTIENLARDNQYIKESFAIDLTLSPDEFRVKAGDIIGFSGNSGSSGGPHLHFEIRDLSAKTFIDPLPYFKNSIEDDIAPQVMGLMIFPQKGKGMINGGNTDVEIKIKNDKSGEQLLSPQIKVWGDVGIGIKAYDKMTGTYNTYLPRKIALEIDGKEIFAQDMGHFSLSETRYLNSLISFEEWIDNKSFFMKSFVESGNKLKIYKTKSNGIINVKEERLYKCRYTLEDDYENKAVFEFEIIGEKQKITENKPRGILFTYDKENKFSKEYISLTIPKGNLYTDIDFIYEEISGYTAFSPLYKLGERYPLHTYCPLKIKIKNNIFPDKTKYGIINVIGTKKSWIGGKYENGYLNTEIRELGNYSVSIDTIAPVIKPENPTGWSKSGKISFKVTDNLSGITEYKGTLDGNFVLFEYEPKAARVFCNFDPQRMKKGKQQLIFTVKDNCGNKSEYKKEISF